MIKHVLGANQPVETAVRTVTGEKNSTVVTVEAPYDILKTARPETYLPSGYTMVSSELGTEDKGFGKLTINAVKYSDTASFSPIRSTLRIDMESVQLPLQDHPKLAGEPRDICLAWLATEESARWDGNGDPQYKDEKTGGYVQIVNATAQNFIVSYRVGITTFNRYYPIVTRISHWSNPPGMTRSNRSFTGGSPTFSNKIGTWEDPPIVLNGFSSGHWFCSADGWVENENNTWTRTEQWTYTPDGSQSSHAWIYS